MIIYIVFLSLLIGTYGLNRPIISLILGLFLMLIIFKEKNKKYLILSLIIIFICNFKMTLFSKNILSNYYLITSSKDNYFIVYNGFSKFYVPLDNHCFKMFDIVKIEGNIINYSFNNYEGLFDFNKYLISKFIFKEIDISKVELIYSFPSSFNLLINTSYIL